MIKYKRITVDLSYVQTEELRLKLLSEFKYGKWTKNAVTGFWIKEFPANDADFTYKQMEKLRANGLKLCIQDI